jgi:hypothetical protein
MKRLLYALMAGVIVYLVAAVLLLALGSTNIFSSPLGIQGIVVVASGIVTAGYVYWRFPSSA